MAECRMPLASKRPVAVCSVSIVLSTTSAVMCRMYLAVRSGLKEVRRRPAIVCVIGACSSVCNAKGGGLGRYEQEGGGAEQSSSRIGQKVGSYAKEVNRDVQNACNSA